MPIVRKPHSGRQPLLFHLRRRDAERRLGCRVGSEAPCETIPNSSANAIMQCPSCASRIPEGSRFCFTCGAAMPSDASVAETVAIADTPASTPAKSQSRPSSLTGSSVRTSSEGRFLPGELLAGRYRVVALLGKGGMGEVYSDDEIGRA